MVRELGGRKIHTRAEAETVLAGARTGDRLKITVERSGRLLEGEIVVEQKP